MSDIEKFMIKAVSDVRAKLPAHFSVSDGDVLVDDGEDDMSVTVKIRFEYGNVVQNHSIEVKEMYGDYGLAVGMDSDIIEITNGSIMSSMYSDLALVNLEDRYIE